ncbi:SRPBCC family protein [Ramlibacter henchirensis]|uniref:SRPBCC family protein n=1 Tax=Ramlibacter henchirensis TaxID=204072 RepID=A0A4Z0BW22_9BURK|nr:SRPBCC family protein [Ramlibacter henchirensis]TFZ02912.1 SRPBCC family protein [Ramlibacter henchirensis]
MISAQREVIVRTPATEVWDFVKEVGNWAAQMPGYVRHEESGSDDSLWTLDIQMGPFSRPVELAVHVARWLPGEGADFTLKATYEPFHGEGSFRLSPALGGTTMRMILSAEVTGSMSKMLTAMAVPVLERIANDFSQNLQSALGGPPEAASSTAETATATDDAVRNDPPVGMAAWLRRWVTGIFRRRSDGRTFRG